MPTAVEQMSTPDIVLCWLNILALRDKTKRKSENWRSTKNAPKTV